MTDGKQTPNGTDDFPLTVARKARHKQAALKAKGQPPWHGLNVFGIVGWSVAIPTLVGIALGVWLDNRFHHQHSWTLTLLPVGLLIGCATAWHWISQEERQIHHPAHHPKEDSGHDATDPRADR